MTRKIYFSLVLLLFATISSAQTIPTPKEHFGFDIGDDYHLATYTQTEAFFKKLAASDRVKLVEMGKTEEGRIQYMLIVSSPENLKNLEKYKEISQKLARAEGLTDEQARNLAAEGKPVVYIDGGLHATETVGAHQLIQTAYELVTRKDRETLRILDNVIILLAHANPDGMELVSNWYMRNTDPKKREMGIPRLYEKYAGHDNNRDFYMMNLKESINITKVHYLDWMPQIIYNHHQAGPAGSVLAGPPYRDPFNHNFDPLIITSIDGVAAAMNNRLNVERKPGYTRLDGSSFSTWWNGGLRTAPYFHNMIGLLTEIVGNPTPSTIPVVPERLIPNNATPNPVTPQEWHFKQSIDYSISLNYAVLDYAQRIGDELLYNIYRMGKNSIERGSQDNWTLSTKRSEAITAAFKADQAKNPPAAAGGRAAGDAFVPGSGSGNNIPVKYYDQILKDPKLRDARGYILPADQADFPTAVRFINALIKSGIQVQKATAAFSVAGKNYPAGSYIVKADQAFRPHILDMFEPQDHPNDFQYPGGPPIRPYDAAGWTLAYQMGVSFDRILDGFDGPFQKIPYGELQSPPKQTLASGSGYLLSASGNNNFIAVNDLLKAGVDVYRIPSAFADMPVGSFYVPSSGKTVLTKASAELGVVAKPIAKRPADAKKLLASRIALFDQYGGSSTSGWTRWILEQYHYPFTVIYPQDVDAGNLKNKYDVILFIDGGIPALRPAAGGGGGGGRAPKPEDIPEEFRSRLGSITPDKSIPQLKAFLEAGGNIVTVGTSTNLAYHLGLPVTNYLVEKTANGQERNLPGDKYYIPGSILRASLDTTQPANWGMTAETDVVFDSSPVFKLSDDATQKGVKPLLWYPTDKPLRSGWAWGQAYLKDGVAAFSAPVGSGMFYAFGPEIDFRAQSHGTFKLLFNELYGSGK